MTSPRIQSSRPCVVLLGTGGTIAGTAARQDDHVGYRAAQLGVAQLVAAVPALSAWRLETEQIAQLDSKDMSHAVWQQLAQAVARQLARPEVAGVVITHGTDTLEETAYFLHRVLAPTKPVVLTAAMRPATALQADGPQNLLDAVTLAASPGARGVLAVLAGAVHSAADLRKLHTYRLDAFGSGDAGPVAVIEQGRLRRFRDWPAAAADAPAALGLALINAPVAQWPRVVLLLSHAGMDAELTTAQIDALRRHGVAGIVVAGTGNGTVHHALDTALQAVADEGVLVWRASRCPFGAVLETAVTFPGAGACTVVQARIELMLQLMRQHAPTSAAVPEGGDGLGVSVALVRLGPWSELGEHASMIRTEVFVQEQQIPAEMEWDVADHTCSHAVAYNRLGLPLATGRLLQHAPGVGRIGRMAVRAPLRGSHVGRAVLAALVQAARARGDHEVILHAQMSAAGFYRRAGFVEHGPQFEEAGITHVEMVLAL